MDVPESQFVEHKQSLGELKDIIESVAAFATCQGGTIRIGIRPNGEPAGVQIGHTTLEDLARDIKLNTDPPQFPSITFDGEEQHAIITVQVDGSPLKPVFAYGRPYTRVGRTNQKLSRAEVQRLMEETTGRTWDALPCPGLTPGDLDNGVIRDFLKRAGQDTTTDTITVLRNLALMNAQGELVNAAALLFAGSPQRFFPQAQLQCARFAGTSSVQFIDEATYAGPVFVQMDDALKFVARNTKQAIRITGKPEHDVVPEYPVEAIREAVINAICHRNYTEPGMVQVRIYDDRLEVWNPGTLPPDLTIEQLYHEHASHPRNPRLAGAFHHAGLVERWGTGTLRIITACQAHGIDQPEFSTVSGNFVVRVRTVAGIILPQGIELNERQKQALTYVHEHGKISAGEYQRLYSIKHSQAHRDLTDMVEAGILAHEKKGRTSYYFIPTG